MSPRSRPILPYLSHCDLAAEALTLSAGASVGAAEAEAAEAVRQAHIGAGRAIRWARMAEVLRWPSEIPAALVDTVDAGPDSGQLP